VEKTHELFRETISAKKGLTSRLKEWFFRRYWGYLMAVSLRYVTDRELARELVNDSFVKIFKALEHFEYPKECTDPEKPMKTWIARITARTCLNELRKQKPDIAHDLDFYDHQMPVAQISDKLELADLLKLLDVLQPLHRAVFNLYEIEGYNHEEIGKLLNIPAGSSRTYLTRAKERMLNAYDKLYK